MSQAELDAAIAEYKAAFAEDRPPDFARFDLALWTKAADALIQGGQLELAAFAARRARVVWPGLDWARKVDRLFDLMPPADPSAPAFADDLSAAVQVVERKGADTALLVFCGANQRAGMPPAMLHRWLARWPASLIYLRDPKSLCYLGGVEPLGADLAATIQALRGAIDELGAQKIVCYGPSAGGYGAFRYGLELEAAAVVTLSGLVNLRPAFNASLRYLGAARRAQTAFPEEVLDLRVRYLATARPPAVFVVYAEHNWDDRIHAEHVAGLEGVQAIQVPDTRTHNTTVELIRANRFDDLIRDAIEAPDRTH